MPPSRALLAAALGADEAMLVRAIAGSDDDAILAMLTERHASDVLSAAHARARAEARAQLFAERGDPAPHRLA